MLTLYYIANNMAFFKPTVRLILRRYSSSASSSAKPFSAIPTAAGSYPLIGHIPSLWRTRHKAGEESFVHQVSLQYGPMVRFKTIGSRSVIMLSDPEGIEQVMRNEGIWPSRGRFLRVTLIGSTSKMTWSMG